MVMFTKASAKLRIRAHKRNLLSAQTVGISAAVERLVMVLDRFLQHDAAAEWWRRFRRRRGHAFSSA